MFDDYNSYSTREGEPTPYELAELSMHEVNMRLYLKYFGSDLLEKLEEKGGGAILRPSKDYPVNE